jgi:hypothetical protein
VVVDTFVDAVVEIVVVVALAVVLGVVVTRKVVVVVVVVVVVGSEDGLKISQIRPNKPIQIPADTKRVVAMLILAPPVADQDSIPLVEVLTSVSVRWIKPIDSSST